jgi:two-component system sensor histidine kinase DegS
VRLWGEAGRIWLEVADDGRGFEPPDLENPLTTDHADHIGLLGMRDRVALLNGTFRIESSPGHGAKIIVSIPLDQPDVSLFTDHKHEHAIT